MKKLYGLVDCNNFFASCERLFQPQLAQKPIVVLSSNDGCVVARSNEAKAIGVPMGAPYFRFKALMDQHGVHVFSSNFHLYGDLSARVMYTLEELAHDVQVYSVDEAFLDMTGVKDPIAHAREIRAAVLRATGIPVSIGIAPTKTLAKAANELAKQTPASGGVWSFAGATEPPSALSQLEIEDVWGVGRQLSIKYRAKGITTAAQLAMISPSLLADLHGRPARETVLELRGTDCHAHRKPKGIRKSLIKSRSFGKKVYLEKHIQEAVAHHVQTAAAKLRKEGLYASYMQVFYRTSIFRQEHPYKAVADITFDEPTNDTFTMLSAARVLAHQQFQRGHQYVKAGIMLAGITANQQASLFSSPTNIDNTEILSAVDHLRSKLGRDAIQFGAEGLGKAWMAQHGHASKKYTRRWEDLRSVY